MLLVQSVNFYFYGVCKLVLLGSPLGHPKGVPCAELSPQVTEGLLSTAIKRFHKELRFFFSLLKRKKEAKKEKSSLTLDEKGNASHEWQSHHFSLPSFNLKWHSLYIFHKCSLKCIEKNVPMWYNKISQTHKGGVEMRKKGIAVFCGLAALFSILFGGFPQKWQVSAAADMTNFAEEAAALTNQFRQENGLPALQLAPALLDLSAQRAEELSQTYGHNRPDGREWFSIIEDSTLDSNCYAAENVAAGYDTPQEAVQAWIDSPTHRKAMLGEPYQYIGIGVYYLPEDTNHYYMYWDMLLISSQEPLEGARYPDSSTATSETAAATTVTTTQTEPVLPRIVGDVNLDDLVDMSDAVLLQKIIMGQVHVNDAQQQNKDCYADGVLDNRDVVVLLQFLVHLFPSLPVTA